jgi:hypothetical protein
MRDVQAERQAAEEELSGRLKESNGQRQVRGVVCGVWYVIS